MTATDRFVSTDDDLEIDLPADYVGKLEDTMNDQDSETVSAANSQEPIDGLSSKSLPSISFKWPTHP